MLNESRIPDDDIISILKKCNAVKFGDFVLASGKRSSYYVDIKKASTNPIALKKISKKISDIIKAENEYKENKDIIIGGVELGGVPIATAVSLNMEKPLLIIRKSEKDYGTKSRYVGEFGESDEIVMIEDVTTSGGSVKKAIEQIREDGGIVNYVVVIVDRCSGANEALESIGVKLIPLVTASDLLKD